MVSLGVKELILIAGWFSPDEEPSHDVLVNALAAPIMARAAAAKTNLFLVRRPGFLTGIMSVVS